VALSAAALGAGAAAAIGAAPNDESFGVQWGDSNTGQPIHTQEMPSELLGPEMPGTLGADDRALKAWGVTTGDPSIVIGEVDTGVDYNHPDLGANIWINTRKVGGCLPGARGYNEVEKTCNPMDMDPKLNEGGYGGHGTHVAGIMGAVGNNVAGVAGMNWRTTILPVRWLTSGNGGSPSMLVEALRWLVQAKEEGVNIRVINESPNFTTDPGEELKQAIEMVGQHDILFVTAAGNTLKPYYPCNWDLPNVICVTATDHNDQIPTWANWGAGVDLAAPGASIYSTLRGGGYGYLSGGSMAAAQVSGAAALILSVAPNLTAEQLKADILNNVDQLPSLQGKVESSGRLDVCKAVPGCEPPPAPPPTPTPPPPPPPPPTIQPSSVALTSTVLKIKHGKLKVGLRCSGQTACASKLALTVKIKTRTNHGTWTSFKTKVLTIGTARFSMGAEGTVQVTIKLNATGRRLVRLGSGRLYANLTIFASAPAPATTHTQRVRLVWPRKRGL
jgi:hypothetical protein